MPIDPTLLTKAAKVYEAAESVEGGKPKEVYESHKQCTPRKPGSATAPADQKNPPMKPVPQPMMKKISAFVFGQLMARNTGK
jgi:hypothetical protein